MKKVTILRGTLTTIGLSGALVLCAPATRSQDTSRGITLTAQKPDPAATGPRIDSAIDEARRIVPEPAAAKPTGPRIDIEISGGVFVNQGRKEQATIRNIVGYLRAKDPRVNIAYSTAAGDVVINDLALRSVDLESFCKAFPIVTDGLVGCQRNNESFGLIASSSRRELRVEAFNLSGYLDRFGGNDEKKVEAALDDVIQIIKETASMLKKEGSTTADQFSVRYHRGTNLLVVVGTDEAIDVARKVVNALAGQQAGGQSSGFVYAPSAVPRRPTTSGGSGQTLPGAQNDSSPPSR